MDGEKIIYVCSPLRGDTEENIRKARDYCRFVVSEGNIPLAIHLLFPQFMDDDNPADRARAIAMGTTLLSKCGELWSFGEPSEGMLAEITAAGVIGVHVRHFDGQCREVRL